MRRAWVALLLAGCTASRPAAPAPGALPVVAVCGAPGDELPAMLVSELSRTGRCLAIRAEEGRKPKADAILTAVVVEFDPYEPPRLVLSVRLQRGSGTGGGDLDRLSQAGTWGSGARTADLAAFDLVLDARDHATREAVSSYARKRDFSGSAFGDEREILAVSSHFMRFAASRVASRLLEQPIAHEQR